MRIKILGDSLAAGYGFASCQTSSTVLLQTNDKIYDQIMTQESWWNHLASVYKEHDWINAGCCGITTFELNQNLDKLIDEKDECIILMIGANNRKYTNGMKLLETDLREMIVTIQKMNKKLILMTQPDSTADNEALSSRIYHMKQVNEIILATAIDLNVCIIDLNYLMKHHITNNCLNYEMFMQQKGCLSDGLHPTSQVQQLMAQCLIPAFKSIFQSYQDHILEITYHPNLQQKAAQWFSNHWQIELQAYLDSMNEAGKSSNSIPFWWIMTDESQNIVAGCGIIQNDFYDVHQYEPNLCALYVEEKVCK